MDHPIQVTNLTSKKNCESWFEHLKDKGCNVGLYKVGKKYMVCRAVEENDIFRGYLNNCPVQEVVITGKQYVEEGDKYSVSAHSEFNEKVLLLKQSVRIIFDK